MRSGANIAYCVSASVSWPETIESDQKYWTGRRGERHSMNFGREVLAGLLGEPERANWQECKLEQAQEEAHVAAFKELFKPFEGTKAAHASSE